jgi:hypothetical protein
MVAATGNLKWLPSLYGRIVIPYEVFQEIEVGGLNNTESVALLAIESKILIGATKLKSMPRLFVSLTCENPALSPMH